MVEHFVDGHDPAEHLQEVDQQGVVADPEAGVKAADPAQGLGTEEPLLSGPVFQRGAQRRPQP